MSELAQLKSQLRSLVVSSPTAVDARALLRDYRNLVGEPLPAARHGYRDPVHFLRERCADCFLFQGPTNNPILTLIVPDQLKHIDEFVQRQRMPSTKNFKVKRRSIPGTYVHTSKNLIAKTFVPAVRNSAIKENAIKENTIKENTIKENTIKENTIKGNTIKENAINNNVQTQPEQPTLEKTPKRALLKKKAESVVNLYSHNGKHGKDSHDLPKQTIVNGNGVAKTRTIKEEGGVHNQKVLHRFLEKRMPLYQSQQLKRTTSADSLQDDDSGRQTASSGSSSSKQAALERLKEEIAQIVAERPGGVWVSQLMRLYEDRFGRELNYARLGFASIAACACACAAATRAHDGDWLLRAAPPASPSPAPSPSPSPAPRLRRAPRPAPPPARALDPDDALPGIEYDADVFPPDCLSFVESIPAASVADIAPGDMIQLEVGEVYSPSHLWILRLGPEHDQMEDIMDEMTEYFTKGEGVNRVLSAGARRPGQYCSSVYDGDWHRSLIVQLVDSDTVKVRHVDYGTVDTVPATSLRPLKRAWAALPAQAVRARLAGLRPPAAGRRWPRAAAAHCLRLVRDRRLVGNVLCVEPEEGIVELLLIDTSTSEDVSVTDEMVRAGHADPRPAAALGASEAYLFPLFEALEAGATPNYAEIHALLRDGIALDYVEPYRRHVPPLLPAAWAPAPLRPPRPPAYKPEALRYTFEATPATPANLHYTLETSHYTPETSHHTLETSHHTLETSHHTSETSHYTPETSNHTHVTSHQTLENLHDTSKTSHHTPDTSCYTPEPESPRSHPEPSHCESDSPPDSPRTAPALVNRVPLIWMHESQPALNSPAIFTPPVVSKTETTQNSATVLKTPAQKENSTPIHSKIFAKSTEKVTTETPTQTEMSTFAVVSQTPTRKVKPSVPQSTRVPAVTTARAQTAPVSQAEPIPPLRPVNQPATPRTLLPARHPPAFYAIPQGYYPAHRFPVAPQLAQFPPRFVHPPGYYQMPRTAHLSADECEVFELLSLVDKNAAHRYVSQALRRSMAAPAPAPPPPAPLNPLAPEFHVTRPPPGFERPQYFPQPPQRR